MIGASSRIVGLIEAREESDLWIPGLNNRQLSLRKAAGGK